MRTAAYLFLVVVLAIGIGVVLSPPSSTAQAPVSPTDQWIALSTDTPDGIQQVVVIDPRSHVMSVYHVEKANGVITLKSVRNVRGDLMMDEFNTSHPLPREIRAILQNR